MRVLYKELNKEELERDVHYAYNKANVISNALQIDKLDFYLISNTRDFFRKTLKDLIKYRFISFKIK